MTEITSQSAKLPAAVERFVLHWGEMGAVWGVNRSVGQIHALLYLSDRPLTAEDLAETLGLARSNVSNSLKELQGWGLIRRVHVMGDRRDHFAAETDLWEMVTRIAEGRKVREIDPTLAVLATCRREAEADRFISEAARRRIAEMHDFVGAIDAWAGQMRRVPRAKLNLLLRLGAAIVRYIPGRAAPASASGRSFEHEADAPDDAPNAPVSGAPTAAEPPSGARRAAERGRHEPEDAVAPDAGLAPAAQERGDIAAARGAGTKGSQKPP